MRARHRAGGSTVPPRVPHAERSGVWWPWLNTGPERLECGGSVGGRVCGKQSAHLHKCAHRDGHYITAGRWFGCARHAERYRCSINKFKLLQKLYQPSRALCKHEVAMHAARAISYGNWYPCRLSLHHSPCVVSLSGPYCLCLSLALTVCVSLRLSLSVCLSGSHCLRLSPALTVCVSLRLSLSVSLSGSHCLCVFLWLSLSVCLSPALTVCVFLRLSLSESLSGSYCDGSVAGCRWLCLSQAVAVCVSLRLLM